MWKIQYRNKTTTKFHDSVRETVREHGLSHGSKKICLNKTVAGRVDADSTIYHNEIH